MAWRERAACLAACLAAVAAEEARRGALAARVLPAGAVRAAGVAQTRVAWAGAVGASGMEVVAEAGPRVAGWGEAKVAARQAEASAGISPECPAVWWVASQERVMPAVWWEAEVAAEMRVASGERVMQAGSCR